MSGTANTPRRPDTPTATAPAGHGTGHSNDRLVTATIDADGYPVALDIREQATALGAARLRDRVLEALRRAHDDANTGATRERAGCVADQPERVVNEATQAVRQIAEQFEDVRQQLFSMVRSGSR